MVTFWDCNLIDAKVDVIIQSNNCQNTQGAGIAKAIRAKYPEVYEADCQTIKGDINKLGTILPVKLNSEFPSYCFLNYNQYKFGRNKRQVDYEAFYKCLEASEIKAKELGLKTLGLPYKMSSCNAGGKWPVILGMIEAVFLESEIECYICKYETYHPF
jgi:O-acetyl-ADP-ribose deacetylase (regulator of RNase III)